MENKLKELNVFSAPSKETFTLLGKEFTEHMDVCKNRRMFSIDWETFVLKFYLGEDDSVKYYNLDNGSPEKANALLKGMKCSEIIKNYENLLDAIQEEGKNTGLEVSSKSELIKFKKLLKRLDGVKHGTQSVYKDGFTIKKNVDFSDTETNGEPALNLIVKFICDFGTCIFSYDYYKNKLTIVDGNGSAIAANVDLQNKIRNQEDIIKLQNFIKSQDKLNLTVTDELLLKGLNHFIYTVRLAHAGEEICDELNLDVSMNFVLDSIK